MKIWRIVVVVLSNAPFSAGLSFGTSHRGSNSSCQQQPFTYLSSQYISLDSIHFTRGIFVSPLKFFHYVRVCVLVCIWELRAHTYSMFVSFFVSFVCVGVFMRVQSKKKEYLHTCLPPLPWEPGVRQGLLGLHSRGGRL